MTAIIATSDHVVAVLCAGFFLCGKALFAQDVKLSRSERFSFPRKEGEFAMYSPLVLQNTTPTETVTEEGTTFYQVISLHGNQI